MVHWGATDQTMGPGSYTLASWLFLRLLGVIYLVAFASLATQVQGLVGSKGVLPATAPPVIARWLLWWVLFRLMFSSGVAKLRSADLAWRDLTALCHHYETQPLPTPVAWHAHQLRSRFHKISAAGMFFIEVLAPL